MYGLTANITLVRKFLRLTYRVGWEHGVGAVIQLFTLLHSSIRIHPYGTFTPTSDSYITICIGRIICFG